MANVKISKELREFLDNEAVQKLINKNKWEEVYNQWRFYTVFYPANELTQILFSIGIDPLNYMHSIPGKYLSNTNITEFNIPKHITSIGNYAFGDCTSLKSIDIPNSITNIGTRAFMYCTSLKTITIPNSVTSIGDDTFESCSTLTNIILSNKITGIGRETFSRCYSLTNIVIPDEVTYIGGWAFLKCNSLTSLTIGKNVGLIGGNVIKDTKIEHINYNNTMSNWKKIDISNMNHHLFSCIINCIDGSLNYNGKIEEWVEV